MQIHIINNVDLIRGMLPLLMHQLINRQVVWPSFCVMFRCAESYLQRGTFSFQHVTMVLDLLWLEPHIQARFWLPLSVTCRWGVSRQRTISVLMAPILPGTTNKNSYIKMNLSNEWGIGKLKYSKTNKITKENHIILQEKMLR